jgi:hypothetical protein
VIGGAVTAHADPLQGVHELQCIHNETSNPCALAASFKELAVRQAGHCLATRQRSDGDMAGLAINLVQVYRT